MSESVDSGSTAELAIPRRDDLDTVLDDVIDMFAVPRPAPPGPDTVHGVANAVKPKAPEYSFGGSRNERASKFKATVPAPGTYDQHNRVGEAQAISSLATAPRPVFGSGDRFHEQETLYTGQDAKTPYRDAPGPGAYPISGIAGIEAPTFSFPRDARGTQKPVPAQKADVPGPGTYFSEEANAMKQAKRGAAATTSSLGRQVASTRRSSPVPRVGTGKRAAFHKQFHGPGVDPVPVGANPGFKYSHQASAMGAQSVSGHRTNPAFTFGAVSPRKFPRNFYAVQEERRAKARQRLLEVTRKWELDIGPGKRKAVNPHDYSWLHDTSTRPSTGPRKGSYTARSDGCELRRGRGFTSSPQFSFSSSSRFSERQFMPHRPDMNVTRKPGPGPKYYLPSRLGETPGHSFSQTKRPSPNEASQKTSTPGPGAYNLREEARVEEHSVAAMLQTLKASDSAERRVATPSPPKLPKSSPLAVHPARRVYSPVRTPGVPLFMSPDAKQLRTQRPHSSLGFTATSTSSVRSSPLARTSPPTRFGSMAGKRTPARAVFDRADRNVGPKIFAGSSALNASRLGLDSPGPTYQTSARASQGPKYSFGGMNLSVAEANTKPSEGGDLLVNVGTSLMKQANSRSRSPAVAHFGSGTRASTPKLYTPGISAPGAHSPGPVYSRIDSVGKQHRSSARTSPRPVIGNAKRRLNEVPRDSFHVPGPGTYGKHTQYSKLPDRDKNRRRAERARRRAAAKLTK